MQNHLLPLDDGSEWAKPPGDSCAGFQELGSGPCRRRVPPTDIWKNKGEGIKVEAKGQEARGSEKGRDGKDKCGIPRIPVLQSDDYACGLWRRLRYSVLVGSVPGAGPTG